MKKSAIFLLVILTQHFLQGQNIAINTTGLDPHGSALLDIQGSNHGVLIPRVSLTATNVATPITSPAVSLMVFNTSSVADVVPGYYYWDGSRWVKLFDDSTIITDHDWYKVGTTAASTSINDNIFTQGNVGIGTVSPLGKLHVDGGHIYFDDSGNNILFDAGQVRITTHDGTGNFQLKQGADNSDRYVGAGNGAVKLRLDENGSYRMQTSPSGTVGNAITWNEAMYVNSAGNVGVGNVAPSRKLHVTGDARVTGLTNKYVTSDASGNLSSVNTIPYSDITGVPGVGDGGIYEGSGSLSGATVVTMDANNLDFNMNNTGDVRFMDGATTLVKVQDNGRVGIGTAAPLAKLHVEGGTRISDLSGTGNRMVIANNNGVLSTQAIPANGDITGVTAGAGLTGGGNSGTPTITAAANNGLNVDGTADRIQLGGALTEATSIALGANNMDFNMNSTGDVRFMDGATTLMKVQDNGRVGIGTAAPLAKLHVEGGTRISDLSGTGNRMVIANNNGVLSTQAIPANGDVTGITAGAGLTGGGNSGTPTITAAANNGLNVDGTADRIQLGGALTEATSIALGANNMDFNMNSTGDVRFMDGATTLMKVQDNGRVGIGTAAPLARLDIRGNILFDLGDGLVNAGSDILFEASGLIASEDDQYINIDATNNGTGRLYISKGSDNSSGTKLLTIQNDGKVGVGTALPQAGLEVANGNVMLNTDNTSYSFNTFWNGTEWKYRNNGLASRIKLDPANSALLIGIAPSGVAGNTATINDGIVLKSNGRVGIGVLDPLAKIHVDGGARISNLSGTGNRMVIANNNGVLSTQAIPANGDITGVTAGAGLTGGGNSGTPTITAAANNGLNVDGTADRIQLGGALTEATSIALGANNMDFNMNNTGDVRFMDGGTTRMIVQDNGRVGIGTAAPNDALTVNGWIGRTAHNNGALVGGFNNIGANSAQTNPIFTIGTNYKPAATTLGNMHGIGYTHTNSSFITDPGPNSWGMYVAADGDARIFLAATAGGSSYFNAGNVGIGTASPSAKLHVDGAARISNLSGTGNRMVIANNNGVLSTQAIPANGDITGVTAGAGLTGGANSGTPTITAAANNGLNVDGTADRIQLGGALTETTSIALGANNMDFNMNNTGDVRFMDGGTTRMIVQDNGRVGIGTATPNDALTINGWIGRTAFNNGALVGGHNNIGGSAAQTNPIFTIGTNFKPAASTLGNMYGIGYTTNSSSFVTSSGVNSWGLYVAADGDARTFLSATSGGVSYINAGNVGIGTSSPTAKLHIDVASGPNLLLSSGTEDIATPDGEFLQFGHWNSGTSTFTERLIIRSDGKVGIGTTSPSQKLHVEGAILSKISSMKSSLLHDGAIELYRDSALSGGTEGVNGFIDFKERGARDVDLRLFYAGKQGSKGSFVIETYIDGASPHRTFNVINANRRVGINTTAPTARLSVNGTANKPGGGSWAVFSDNRLKQNISPNLDGMDLLEKVNVVSYQYNKKFTEVFGENEQIAAGKKYYGVIAQELKEIIPDMVNEVDIDGSSETFLEVDPSRFTYMLINAAKEQRKENKILKQQLNEQQRIIEEQQLRLESIERKLLHIEK